MPWCWSVLEAVAWAVLLFALDDDIGRSAMEALFAQFAQYQFLQYTLLACLLASIGCGIVGSYVVVRRMTLMSGSMAHAVFSGMGIAYFMGVSPLAGALLSALVIALIIGWISTHWQQQDDVLLSALWSSGMAVGIIFMAKTPSYNVDLFSYLFGNILLIRKQDLLLMLCLDCIVVLIVSLGYQRFLGTVFDEEFARLRGVHTRLAYYGLLLLVAMTVVLLIRIVGLILVICLLAVPAASAALFVNSLKGMMVLACAICLVATWSGLLLSMMLDWPASATMVLLACTFYTAALLFTRVILRRGVAR